MKINLTPLQILGMTAIFLSVILGGTAQLTDIFGPGPTKIIAAMAGLANGIVGGFITFLSGQSGLLQSVQSMPGVDKIVVNASANQTLAQIAVDPNSKVEATPQAQATVEQTAKG